MTNYNPLQDVDHTRHSETFQKKLETLIVGFIARESETITYLLV
jgi:hypothetical protein